MWHRRINKNTVAFAIFSSYLYARREHVLPNLSFAFCALPDRKNIPHAQNTHHFLNKSSAQAQAFSMILPIRPIRGVTDETLLAWEMRTTRDFQLLDFAPVNLIELLALLALLGITKISFSEFGRVTGGNKCFLTRFPSFPIACKPRLIFSSDDALSMINELSDPKIIVPSFEPTISNASDHVKPHIEKNIKNAIDTGALASFYENLGKAGDRELNDFCHAFLGETFSMHHVDLFQRLKQAQSLCRTYSVLIAKDHQFGL